MANKTVSDIYGAAQDFLKIDGESSGVPGLEEPQTIKWIDDLQKQYYEEFYGRGMVAPDELKGAYGFGASAGTYLDGNAGDTVSAGADTFTVYDSDGLPSSGVGVIYDGSQYDVFSFTGNSAGTVSGVDGVDFDHEDGNTVERLYPLPATFGRMRPGINRGHGVVIGGQEYFEQPEAPSGYGFSLYQSGSDWYLWLPRGATGKVMVHYDKAPTTLTDDISEITIQAPHDWYVIWGLIAIFRQILDEDYVPQKEKTMQNEVILKALQKRNAGKRLICSSRFYGRYR